MQNKFMVKLIEGEEGKYKYSILGIKKEKPQNQQRFKIMSIYHGYRTDLRWG